MAVEKKVFLILGGGGHGKVVADVIRAAGHRVAGYVDSTAEKLGTVVEPGGGRVWLLQDELWRLLESGEKLPAGANAVVVAVGNNRVRLELIERLGEALCPVVAHPSAVVSPSARLGAGTVVFPASVINADAQVGRGVIVNTGAIVEHDCQADDGAHLSPQAVLCGAASLGARSWLGAGGVVIHGVSVGRDTIVGAGAVVVRDLGDDLTVVGNPARIIRRGGKLVRSAKPVVATDKLDV